MENELEARSSCTVIMICWLLKDYSQKWKATTNIQKFTPVHFLLLQKKKKNLNSRTIFWCWVKNS